MKIGNTSFNKREALALGFKEFKKTYEGKLKGATVEQAWKALGGSLPSKSKKQDSGDGETKEDS